MRRNGVRCLLMGGQACVFYGAAEFSRDVDLALVADDENLSRLSEAFEELQASVIAVPPFDPEYLHEGLAVHFRCAAPGVEGLRVDVISVMRGVDDFPDLWERRTSIELDGVVIDMLSLPDLVRAKKTQRAKDWPMVRRLIEAHWFQNERDATPARIDFWFRECRTAELLLEMVGRFGSEAQAIQSERPVVAAALGGDIEAVERALEEERHAIVREDKAYWVPLREKLESLRRRRPRGE
jgi:hypothetical protein